MAVEAAEQNATIGWWGRFADPVVETKFREYHAVREHRQAVLAITAGMIINAAFIFNDKILIASTRTLWYLVSARLLFVTGSAILLLMLWRGLRPAGLDRLLLLWASASTALTVAVGFTRTGVYFLGLVFVSLFILWVFYFVVPLSFPVQVSATMVIVVCHLCFLAARPGGFDPILRRTAFVSYFLTALMGIFVPRNLHVLRREHFAHLQQEIRLRSGLEAALAEVRTLQGILPICAHCKNVRTDEGSWERIEVYVREHSNADFSHGICPSCAQIHFPGYLKGKGDPTGL